MILILGETGLIGNQISTLTSTEKYQSPNRNQIFEWSKDSIPKEMDVFFKEKSAHLKQVFVATGITNPDVDFATQKMINFQLPANILRLADIYGFQVITFGTIHEESHMKNDYILTKKMYREYIGVNSELPYRHFQLHTLFGKHRMARHSFLGQISESIFAQKVFKMSSGNQLREFHEVSVDVASVFENLNKAGQFSKVEAISNGQVIKLRDVATHIFAGAGCSHLLEIGGRTTPMNEIYDLDFFSRFKQNQSPNPNLMKSIELVINLHHNHG